MNVTPVRVALIGAGWVAEHCYLPALRLGGGLDVVAVYDSHVARAERLAEALGLSRPAREITECLGPSVQGVVICAPAYLHLPLIVDAIAAGKHVLCEKAVVRYRDEIATLASINGIASRLMGSATMRLRQDVQLALSWIRSGCIGRLNKVRLGWWRASGVPSPGSWRTDSTLSPGGVLEDLGPHLLDIATAALPEELLLSDAEMRETQLACRYGTSAHGASWFADDVRGHYEVPDFARACFSIASGPLIEIELSWAGAAGGDFTRLTFEGSEGNVELRGLIGLSTCRRTKEQVCSLVRHGNIHNKAYFRAGPGLQHQAFRRSLDNFADFCRGTARPVADFREITQVTNWLNDIVHSTPTLMKDTDTA